MAGGRSRVGPIVLHLVALLALANGFAGLATLPANDAMSALAGGRWGYLTVCSLAVSVATFAFALAEDLTKLKIFHSLKIACATIVVPVEGIVAILYWSMTAYDPTLLVPADSKMQIPLPLDITLHALPFVFLWLDFLLYQTPLEPPVSPIVISAVATTGYVLWMERNAALNKAYPYPFLNETPFYEFRLPFYIIQGFVLLGLFYTANALHRALRPAVKRQIPRISVHSPVQAKKVQ